MENTCEAIVTDMVAEYTHGNAMALAQLAEDPDVELRRFPDDVLTLFKSITKDLVDEMSANDPMAAKIQASYYDYLEKSASYQRISEQAYLETRKL